MIKRTKGDIKRKHISFQVERISTLENVKYSLKTHNSQRCKCQENLVCLVLVLVYPFLYFSFYFLF